MGAEKVYFQPPESIKLVYPCIIYTMDDMSVQHADNRPYRSHERYSVMVIRKDPDSEIPGKVSELPMCSFERSYTADNLIHDVFSIYT